MPHSLSQRLPLGFSENSALSPYRKIVFGLPDISGKVTHESKHEPLNTVYRTSLSLAEFGISDTRRWCRIVEARYRAASCAKKKAWPTMSCNLASVRISAVHVNGLCSMQCFYMDISASCRVGSDDPLDCKANTHVAFRLGSPLILEQSYCIKKGFSYKLGKDYGRAS